MSQKLTTSLMAAAASAGTSLRAMKSSQSLNFAFARASMIALERAGPMCGSLSSSAAVAVLRLVLTAWLAEAPVVAGFAGAVTAGAGFAGFAGCVPCAKAGADRSASVTEVTRTRRVNIAVVLSVIPHGLMRVRLDASELCDQAERAFTPVVHASQACNDPIGRTHVHSIETAPHS